MNMIIENVRIVVYISYIHLYNNKVSINYFEILLTFIYKTN